MTKKEVLAFVKRTCEDKIEYHVEIWSEEDIINEAGSMDIDIPIETAKEIIRQIDNNNDGCDWETIDGFIENLPPLFISVSK